MVEAAIFDYGGVLAEEGFAGGLKAIAMKNGLDPQGFLRTAADLIYETGYVTGRAGETLYLDSLRKVTWISDDNETIRGEILRRFVLRPEVIGYVEVLRTGGLTTAILSDQTDWLEELNARDRFFGYFDHVFNSFRIGKGKRDPSVFGDVCRKMGVQPGKTVFVDDNPGNISRASAAGLNAILFASLDDLKEQIKRYLA